MKKNGFVTSALLYGILSMFLLLILGTISIIANRKVTNDKIKQSALDDVQALTTDSECFRTAVIEEKTTITEYLFDKCSRTVFIPGGIEAIGTKAFKYTDGEYLINVTIPSSVSTIASDAFEGQKDVLFILKNPNPDILTSASEFKTMGGDYWGAESSTHRVD